MKTMNYHWKNDEFNYELFVKIEENQISFNTCKETIFDKKRNRKFQEIKIPKGKIKYLIKHLAKINLKKEV